MDVVPLADSEHETEDERDDERGVDPLGLVEPKVAAEEEEE